MKEKRQSYFQRIKHLPRNVWAVSLTSFFMDISSEMVINILPLFLSNVLGVKTNIIGLIEGVAEATASILKLFSGWFSDKIGGRKWPAVVGYGISALTKPFFYFANSWGAIAGARWIDRVGKGIRTSPRDALVADSVTQEQRGLAFGFHRAADTGGAMLGLMIALLVTWLAQRSSVVLTADTFRTIVLISIVPAFLAVLALALGTKEVSKKNGASLPSFAFKKLGKPFMVFMLIVAVFDLGNSSDAFLVLRAQERGLSVLGILGMLITFNLIYTLISTPAGALSDRFDRRWMIIVGWLVYGVIYLGFALAKTGTHIWILYGLYGFYYGLTYGTAKAMVADLVPENLRGTAYGTYNGVLGLLDFPASVIAGILWQGAGTWQGFGPAAPFLFGAVMALLAALLLLTWRPQKLIS
ncbi:MAG: MFS transporter [Chloroflexi bacterium HGW-Chloroflexi-10]|nr:MAG: MFS transporter [Chloroflexi bacterium HGW-Chloroflexi-10]